MPRRIVRDAEVCRGRPTVEGSRLTCANVVLLTRNGQDITRDPWSYAAEDVLAALTYCSRQECRLEPEKGFCQQCSLEPTPDDPGDVDPEPRPDLWTVAAQLLQQKGGALRPD